MCFFQAFQEQSSHVKEVFLGLATVRTNNSARNRRSSLMHMFKNGKENMNPPVLNYPTNFVSSIAPSSITPSSTTPSSIVPSGTPSSATDRVSLTSDTNGGATSTPGEDSSNEGISDLELGNLPDDTPSAKDKSKQKKKNSHRRLGSFVGGVRPNDDGNFHYFSSYLEDCV